MVLNFFKRKLFYPFSGIVSIELIAEITSLDKCSKNGRCIFYKYEYNGIEYKGRSRIDLSFSGWCKSKNECKGLKFKITVMKSNPEKRYADWNKIFNDKLNVALK